MHTVTEITRQPKLLFRSGENRGKVLALEKDRVTIGRDTSNDIVLPDETISSFHASVSRAADGTYWLEDSGSKNGTFVGNERIRRRCLADEDAFCLCRDGPELQFLYGDPELPTLVESTATVFRRTHSVSQALREILPRWGRDKSQALSIGCVEGVRALDQYGLDLSSRRARRVTVALMAGFLLLCAGTLATTIWIFWRHTTAEQVVSGDRPAASSAELPGEAPSIGRDVGLELALEPIYASLFLSYRERPIGKALVENRGKTAVSDLRLEFFFEGEGSSFLVEPFEIDVPELRPGERRELAIAPKLSADILSDYTREVTARALLHSRRSPERTAEACAAVSRAVFVYGRNIFNWEDPRRVAAFVDPDDPAVRLFLREVWAARPVATKQEFPPPNVVGALTLLSGLAEFGLRYLPDATNPISARTNWKANDRVSYPLQTFAAGSGDCDDLSVLCCAVLEAAGIPTAMAVGRNHVFFLFDAGIPADLLEGTAFDPETVVNSNGRLWIPVEATEIARPGATFAAAWAAAWIRRDAIAEDEFEIVVTAEGWKVYQPLNRPPAKAELERLRPRLTPRSGLDARVKDALGGLRSLFRQNLASRVESIRATYDPGDTAADDEIGLLYAQSGLFMDAAGVFRQTLFPGESPGSALAASDDQRITRELLVSLETDARSEAAGDGEATALRLMSLGICLSLGGHLDAAIPYAQAAAEAFPREAVVERGEALLRLALIHRLRGDLSAEKRWLNDAFLLEPSLRDLYTSLLKGDGTVAGPEEQIRDFLKKGLTRG